MNTIIKRRVWLDVWSSDNHVEAYVRYHAASNVSQFCTPNQDCLGGGVELFSKTFEVWYRPWYRRFYVSIWIIAFWFDLPRMKMLQKFYEAQKEREKK
jgi:hypothetical protein